MRPVVTAEIDIARMVQNLERIRAGTRAEVWAVIKADAYGLGAAEVASRLADGVDGFCVFSLKEALKIDLWRKTGRPAIALGPPETLDPRAWIEAHVRPAVSNPQQAAALRAARPILCVDTGMQRFSCPAADVDVTIRAGAIDEAFTHATRIGQVELLKSLTSQFRLRLHSSGSGLLEDPRGHLDAVRPGLAIYRGVGRVRAKLVEVRRSVGPIGYGGWVNSGTHHGVILTGYSTGIRAGPAEVNGRRQRIVEVGMQSAYVTLDEQDRLGDWVTLLGGSVNEGDVAAAWGCTTHEALVTLIRVPTHVDMSQ